VKLHLRVITPASIALDEQCDMVIVRCVTGDMGFLPRHEACSAILGDGDLRILNGKDERRMRVSGGIVQIKNNEVTILTTEELGEPAA
jgi:F-type H+-transporting ATPase subunit epsilon